MGQPPPIPAPHGRWSTIVRDRTAAPSWLASLVLHMLLLIILGLTLRMAPRQGASAERTAEVGIALKRQDGDREHFESQDNSGEGTNVTAASAAGAGLEQLLNDTAEVDPTSVLPSIEGVIGAGPEGGVPNAGEATAGPRGRTGPGSGGQTSLFGIPGEGFKFVYVFDRSGSMGGTGRNALSAAKTELVASLQSLDTNHQFQIIFYNEYPAIFNPSGQPGKLAFGTERNKTLARKFIGSITADGATRHEDALLLAIKLQPDVIFFLTDADQPKLSPRQLDKIRRRATGITINTVEFGFGPQSDANNFLVRLARQNGGQHVYVDISKLYPVRRDSKK